MVDFTRFLAYFSSTPPPRAPLFCLARAGAAIAAGANGPLPREVGTQDSARTALPADSLWAGTYRPSAPSDRQFEDRQSRLDDDVRLARTRQAAEDEEAAKVAANAQRQAAEGREDQRRARLAAGPWPPPRRGRARRPPFPLPPPPPTRPRPTRRPRPTMAMEAPRPRALQDCRPPSASRYARRSPCASTTYRRDPRGRLQASPRAAAPPASRRPTPPPAATTPSTPPTSPPPPHN